MDNLANFLIEIRDLHYVVQRHWGKLPHGFIDGHPDLDLIVSGRDNQKLLDVVEKYPELPIDVRSMGDGYYPLDIGTQLLTNRILKEKIFWVPNPKAHFLSLYYHNLVHKEGDPYAKELKEIFKQAYPPIHCEDQGVGHHDNS